MPSKRRGRRVQAASHFPLRLAVFVGVALLVVGAAGWLLWPQVELRASPTSASEAVRITMDGFTPQRVSIPAGQQTTVRIVNPDSPYHTDGGGVHQFAVPALGVDVNVQPMSSAMVTLPAAAPGRYAFYCDTCCGGKENPTMQGTIVVS